MQTIYMLSNDEKTWLAEVVDYLERHRDIFLSWELSPKSWDIPFTEAREAASRYDRAVYGLRDVLSGYTLHEGYHCTRLTKSEIHHILSDGLQLPNGALLRERIQAIVETGLIEPHIADRLKLENQADEDNRAGLIWFCFFPPHVAGQTGIERFFRSWGGEALYNSHEHDPVTGPILKGIGTPCLIEANVPIASLAPHTFLDNKFARRFLINRGFKTREPIDHEDRAIRPISVLHVRRVIQFPESDFVALTNCDSWTPPLT
jgi:hypothetical protein